MSATDRLNEIIAHLRVAEILSLPSDPECVTRHVLDALQHARALRDELEAQS